MKKSLTKKLEQLLVSDRDDGNLAELINIRVHLNWEIDKDEAF